MGAAAVVSGDKITAQCAIHLVPTPAGAPTASPAPMPFSAPLLTGLATTVFIAGKPAAVQGSSGMNTPPHVGLHPSDPSLLPVAQQGRVITGSSTVFFNNRPAAYSGCPVTACASLPAQVTGTATTVQVSP
jgi:uncharacterized Zn-binding protein involved in type VI secretion